MDNAFALFIIITLFLLWNLDFIATLLNLRALKPELPEEFVGIYDADKYAQSQNYTRTGECFGIVKSIASLAILLIFWFAGGFGYLDQLLRGLGYSEIITGLLFIGLLIIGNSILQLPFEIYSTFVIEARYGFNKTTPKTFIIDHLKGFLLGILIAAPILALILWIFASVSHAWFWAWLAFTLIQLGLTYLAPTYIMPIFNKFEPLEDGELKSAITDMAKKCDFPLTEIHIMDGSKRSTKSNAFFTGFGKNKKIALFDTLIKNHTTAGLVGVLAHEIGHFKCKHIIQRMVVGILQTAVIFYLLGLFTTPDSSIAKELFAAFQVDHVSVYAGLFFFTILFTPVSRLLAVLANMTSRKHEFEADAYAAKAQGTPDHLVGALKQLASDNLANLTPHPFTVFLDYSHPPMLTRINALKSLKL